jgi:UDP-4-amino-4,6-dideoxy-N-acetyl-beta-L-altrosamine transaminase
MDFIPYSRQSITQQDIDAVTKVLKSEYLTQGPAVTMFESEFARVHGASHAVAVSSATAGLHMACVALGVGSGSLVWTSPNTFLASANCALYCGADVDFVDIDPATRNMSVAALATKLAHAKSHGRLPQVVVPVDFAGLPCDLSEMKSLADAYGFKILEDASHAIGSIYLGHPVGSRFADLTVFSCHAVKIITTAEGGVVTTQSAELDRILRLLRSHGMTRDRPELETQNEGDWYYEQKILGFNYRMTDIQAALGVSQLPRLAASRQRRHELAARYNRLLSELPLILPTTLPDRVTSWHLYVVEIDQQRTDCSRKAVFQRMRAAGIGVNVHYIPVHIQPYYSRLGFRRGAFPNSERYYDRALTLPLYPDLTDEQQGYVVKRLHEALEA